MSVPYKALSHLTRARPNTTLIKPRFTIARLYRTSLYHCMTLPNTPPVRTVLHRHRTYLHHASPIQDITQLHPTLLSTIQDSTWHCHSITILEHHITVALPNGTKHYQNETMLPSQNFAKTKQYDSLLSLTEALQDRTLLCLHKTITWHNITKLYHYYTWPSFTILYHYMA